MVKKMKKVLSTALSIFLMLSVVIQTSIVYAEEVKSMSTKQQNEYNKCNNIGSRDSKVDNAH